MRLGILGGTFDPLHWGHLFIAEETRDLFNLDSVLFIPAKIPPHKIGKTISSETHRLEMLNQVIQDHEAFDFSDMEFNRPGPSYTVETLKEVQRQNPEAELYFIMGQDSFLEIETWYQYQELFSLCRLVVVRRPGTAKIEITDYSKGVQNTLQGHLIRVEDPLKFSKKHLKSDWKVCLLMISGMLISASEIRQRVLMGRTIRYLVPEAVRQYISRQNLYGQEVDDENTDQ